MKTPKAEAVPVVGPLPEGPAEEVGEEDTTGGGQETKVAIWLLDYFENIFGQETKPFCGLIKNQLD